MSAVLPPARLHALERRAVTAFTETYGPETAAAPAPAEAPPEAPRVAAPPAPAPPAPTPPPVVPAGAPPLVAVPAAPAPPPPPVVLPAPPPPRPAVPPGPPGPPGPATRATARRPAGRRRAGRLALPVGLVATAAGLAGLVASVTATPRIGPPTAAVAQESLAPSVTPARPAPEYRRGAGPVAARTTRTTRATPAGPRPLPRARPVLVEVPRLDIRADVRDLGLRPDGSLDVPADVRVSGWYAGGPAPGQRGAAVVVGHVDGTAGPGVFHPLLGARAGDEVTVRRADGTAAAFRVYRVAAYPKTAFPTDLVYRSDGMELRLVTCSGEFDRATRHYRDNLVVFARRIG